MSTIHSLRLEALAVSIEGRDGPLGIGLKSECWAGVAHQIASAENSRVTDFFGISFAEMKAAIKGNNACAPNLRNNKMARFSRELAATR